MEYCFLPRPQTDCNRVALLMRSEAVSCIFLCALYCMYCIDIKTLIINNIIIHKYNMQTAPDCSTVPLCSCAVRQKERQVAAEECKFSATSAQQCATFVQHCATERSLLARADYFFCNSATLLARFVATAPRNASALVARST